jgi:hypothetical protein
MAEADPRPHHPEQPRVLPRYSQEQLTESCDELGRKRYHTPEGRAVCGRLKNRNNRQVENEACLGPPMPAGPCRVHGGASPGPPLKAGGRYSKHLTRWKARFEAALSDKSLLDVRPDIAMMDTVVADLVARAEELDTPGWRAALVAAFDELNKALRAGRQKVIGPALKRLEELIQRGAEADRVGAELTAALDRRAERATKTLALQARSVEQLSKRDLMILFGGWVELLKQHLHPTAFRNLLPHLREFSSSQNFTLPGTIESIEAGEAAAETLVELEAEDDDES